MNFKQPKKLKKLALKGILGSCLLLTMKANAQDSTVFKGQILDSMQQPIVNASILLKGSNKVTYSNDSGYFSIKSIVGNTLVISIVGFDAKDYVIPAGKNNLPIIMTHRLTDLDDVVVVGYGSVKKKDLTGSVSIVNVDNAKKAATYDVAKMLQGQAAGVSVQGSGEPGGFVSIKIRGISTFGNNSPLFVIDGIPVDNPYDFSPDDIESIQVLKDASAAAIYGSRAATGVVIITTKKGKNGPPIVRYNGYVGMQHLPRKLSLTDSQGYQKIVYAAETNAGIAHTPGNDPSNPNYITDINTDWQKEATKTGLITDHTVGISGGSKYTTYNVDLGYFDQTGYQKGPQNYNRYTVNSSLQGHKGKFAFGGKFSYVKSHKGNYGVTNGHAVYGGSVTSMVTAIPTMPVLDSTHKGGYGGVNDAINGKVVSTNVVGLNNMVTDWSNRERTFLNGWGEVEFVKNLKYKINISYDRTNFKNFHYEPSFDMGYYYINSQYYMMQQMGTQTVGIVENLLTYNLKTGKHRLDLLAGMTYQENKFESMTASAQDDGDLQFQTFDAIANSNAKNIVSYKDGSNLLSYLGRVNYNYDERYLLTVNLRRDGSSKFSPANRYGNFYGVAAAWNIANEHFLNLPSDISTLKLRAGYGSLGNQSSLGAYSWQSYIINSANYLFNNSLATGSTNVSVTDQNLKWETTTTTNIAMDFGFFNDALTLTAEYFKRKSTNILTSIPIPYSVGSYPQSVTTNAASVENHGFEFTLGYKKTKGDFNFDISTNFYTLSNKVLSLGGNNSPIYGAGSKTEVGHEVGELYGYRTEGIFQSEAQVQSHAYQNASTGPGDVIFQAQNGNDNNHDYTITDAKDRVYLGSAIPKFYFGFNYNASYKNFDLSLFFQGNLGSKVFNAVYQSLMSGGYNNAHTDELNYWTPTNTNTNIPKPAINDPSGNNRFSDRFVQSGSYMKFQNAQIGYTFSSKLMEKYKIKNLRVYLSGQNLWTITKYKGYDPDFISDGLFSRGYDYGSFPNPRTYMFGLQLSF